MIRIGQGFDVHAFADEGNEVVLCGVRIPSHRALKAHSDGDVAIHALCDALLGALAMGDIGEKFPDSDPQYAGVDSRRLLREVCQWMRTAGYELGNADLTIIAQHPVISPHKSAMRENIAHDLDCAPDQINIKATTTESLGFIGREEGIAAMAVVLVQA